MGDMPGSRDGDNSAAASRAARENKPQRSSPPAVSIVVPTRNRPEMLLEALASIEKQSVDRFECIVVDDGDHHPATLGRFEQDDRFRLIAPEGPEGPAAARNRGIAAAKGDAVTFLDDDDTFLPRRLEIGLLALERAPIGLCWARFDDEPSTHRGRKLYGDVHSIVLDATTPHSSAAMVDRSVLVNFDPTYRASEDVEWWIRQSDGVPVFTVEDHGVILRRHLGVRTGYGNLERRDATLRMLTEHADYFRQHPRARAFRLRRAALSSHSGGDRRAARGLLWRAFLARPDARGLAHLARSLTGVR